MRPQRGSGLRFSFDDWMVQAANGGFGMTQPLTTWGKQDTEPPPNSFEGYVQSGYKANGVVFAVISARMRLFSEVRFQWQDMPNGRPGELNGTEGLDLLSVPWRNATTRTLLAHMEQDVSLGGNSFTARRLILDRNARRTELRRLRPDWVDIVIASPSKDPFDIDATVGGYLYHPQGRGQSEPIVLFPETVAHFAPVPDPTARFRGMSWLTPVVREIQADTAATIHKGKFFDNAATPNLAVTMPITEKAKFLEAVAAMDDNHKGAANAYKTLWLMGGATTEVIGADMKQLDFAVTQGAGETRIAAAGGVPPIIVGLKEGLQAATYSNYGQARRAFADHWARPQWGDVAGCLQSIFTAPSNKRLWYDADGISFLQEDQMDAAEIQSRKMLTIESGVRAGFEPASVLAAVAADDLTLMQHTGLYSVQLQPPGSDQPAADPAAP